jgi:hypothetical protein
MSLRSQRSLLAEANSQPARGLLHRAKTALLAKTDENDKACRSQQDFNKNGIVAATEAKQSPCRAGDGFGGRTPPRHDSFFQ